jgi:hypothetical protein
VQPIISLWSNHVTRLPVHVHFYHMEARAFAHMTRLHRERKRALTDLLRGGLTRFDWPHVHRRATAVSERDILPDAFDAVFISTLMDRRGLLNSIAPFLCVLGRDRPLIALQHEGTAKTLEERVKQDLSENISAEELRELLAFSCSTAIRAGVLMYTFKHAPPPMVRGGEK